VVAGRALRHLSKYMRWIKQTGEKVVVFGQNMVFGGGEIRVGDEVVLIDRRIPPLAYGPKA